MPLDTKNISTATILPDPARTQFGWVTYPPGGTLGPRVQTGLQMVAIESGEAVITVGGRRRSLAAGEVCLLGPGQREYFQFARRQKTVHSWCTMFFEGADEHIVRCVGDLPFATRLTPTMRELIALGLEGRGTSEQVSRALGNALGKATYFAFVTAVGASSAPARPYPLPVERARAFVADNLGEPMRVADMARAAGVSGNQLTRLFKRHLKTTPSRYLWQARTREAVNLLQNTGLSVAEIAYRVGFATPFHFSRLSKQLYGLSPKALRQQFWGEARGETEDEPTPR